jgi:hypothetical protein
MVGRSEVIPDILSSRRISQQVELSSSRRTERVVVCQARAPPGGTAEVADRIQLNPKSRVSVRKVMLFARRFSRSS